MGPPTMNQVGGAGEPTDGVQRSAQAPRRVTQLTNITPWEAPNWFPNHMWQKQKEKKKYKYNFSVLKKTLSSRD